MSAEEFVAGNGVQVYPGIRGGSLWVGRKYVTAKEVGALREYFRAERGFKPWHDAEPGEVWWITTQLGTQAALVSVEGVFQVPEGTYALDNKHITSATRRLSVGGSDE